jgi:hypothetical protein
MAYAGRHGVPRAFAMGRTVVPMPGFGGWACSRGLA